MAVAIEVRYSYMREPPPDSVHHEPLTRGTEDSAGYDLRADQATVVPARGQERVSTNLKLEIPRGFYGYITPRSGLAFNSKIMAVPGVIDSDYRGEIMVLLTNNSDKPYQVGPGMRIAQMVFLPYMVATLNRASDLSETVRAEKGFGSTGLV